jgi:hypothetical protein
MRHATETALDALEPLLQRLRTLDGLTEKRRGIFYRRSVAFLHFHEDAAGLFADLRIGSDWQRFPASGPRDQQVLIAAIRGELGARKGAPRLRNIETEPLLAARPGRR